MSTGVTALCQPRTAKLDFSAASCAETSLMAPALPADSAFMNAIYHLTGILPTDPGELVGSACLAA